MTTYEKPTFESIVLEHGTFIRRTLAQLGVASRDLRDVEQEVLRGVNRRLPAFDPELAANPANAVRAWLFAICERQAANHRRTRARRAELIVTNDELDTSAASGPNSEERLVFEQRKAVLMRLLDELEPQRRAVIVAYELEGIAMADVAVAFSIPVNTAWNRLRLAREDLREAFERHERKRRAHGVLMPLPPLAALLSGAASQNAGAGAGVVSNAGSVVSGFQGWLARAGIQLGVKAAVHAPVAAVLSSGAAGLAVAGVVAAVTMRPPDVPAPEPSGLRAALVVERPAIGPAPSGSAAEPMSTSGQGPAPDSSPPAGTAAPVSTGVRRSVPGRTAPSSAPRDVDFDTERRYVAVAEAALAKGDVAAARAALDAHTTAYPAGRLSGERESLYLRLHLHEGLRNQGIDRARAFVAKNPGNSQRAAMEKLVGPLD